MNIACSILAGGKNSRLGGKNKALIKIDTFSIIEKNIECMEKLFDEIIIVSNKPQDFAFLNNSIKIVPDLIKNIGPLGGIYTSLYYSKKQSVFITPCDMPFLNVDLINLIIQNYYTCKCDIFAPRINRNIEPLHAIYNKSILEKLYNYIIKTNNYSIRGFYKKVNVHFLDLENNEINNKAFTNINTIDDIKSLKDKFKIKF